MKTLNALTLVALVTGSFLASSCEKTSDSVAPLSAANVAKDARPEEFNPDNLVVDGTSSIHGEVATGLPGLTTLTLTKIQPTGNSTMFTYKGVIPAGGFPAGGYATPFVNTFYNGGYWYDCVATLDANGNMTLKESISKTQYPQ